MKKPNIVIINPDQMRADSLHHLGNAAAYTPNMDALLRDGVSFQNAFCQNTVCVPSRCSFMTGLYPHVNGHRTMSNLLKRDEGNLFFELRQQSYYVWDNERGDLLVGNDETFKRECIDESVCVLGEDEKFANFGRGEKDGDNYFSFYRGVLPVENDVIVANSDWQATEKATQFIKEYDDEKPLCMFLGYFYPHPPYAVEPKFFDLIDKSKLPKRIETLREKCEKSSMLFGLVEELGIKNWDEERFDNLRAVYLAMVAKVDYMVGEIVKSLKEKGIYDETAIFIFSDHGDFTGDYGVTEKAQNTFEDCLTNVPFIVKLPKEHAVSCGVNSTAMVELIDFYATAIELGGAKIERTHFGKSLFEAMANKNLQHREFVTCEGGRNREELHCSENGVAVFGGDEYAPRKKLQASDGDFHTKATMLRTYDYKYVKRQNEKDEFYDLTKDKESLKNAIDDPNYREIIFELKDKMLEWYQRTCDVVPFEQDQRFSNAKFCQKLEKSNQLSKPLLEEVKRRTIEGDEKFFKVLEEIKNTQH